jgi:hypothetical protein
VLKIPEKWLEKAPWEVVVQINQSFCTGETTPHRPGKGFDATQQLWNQAATQPMRFRELLDLCHKCHNQAPFAFFNGNTFAKVLQHLLKDAAAALPSLEGRMLQTAAANYVAGTIGKRELESVCDHVDDLLQARATK